MSGLLGKKQSPNIHYTLVFIFCEFTKIETVGLPKIGMDGTAKKSYLKLAIFGKLYLRQRFI
jgi:hypothetical protein